MLFAKKLKQKLNEIINEMDKNTSLFVKDPLKNFTRKRKLTFSKVIKAIMFMGGNTLDKELLKFFEHDKNCVSSSAFIQQRDKILPEAFKHILKEINKIKGKNKVMKGYKLIAVDGSDLSIFADPKNKNSYYKHENSKSYALLHLNAMYDLLNKKYIDIVVNPSRNDCERTALLDMIHNYDEKEIPIYICDRGYEAYNIFAHIETSNSKYIIRVKDINSNGVLKGYDFENCQFDKTVTRMLTRRTTKEVNSKPEYYKYLNPKINFDFLEPKSRELFNMTFRVVRFKIGETKYESLITNLSEEEFSLEEFKELYNLRWGIETAFRELKYVVGLSNLHAKKVEYILQEIYAKLIIYNLSTSIISQIDLVQNKKFVYAINISVAIEICIDFFRNKKNLSPHNLETTIKRYTVPIRPDRSFERNTKPKSFTSFNYRVS